MVRGIFVAVVFIAAVASGFAPTKAAEAPWCAVTSGGAGDMHWDCHYRSIEECRPNVLGGNRGYCNQNPYYVAQAPKSGRSGKRRARPQ
jgi:Protein of unknown function (DUF3551)